MLSQAQRCARAFIRAMREFASLTLFLHFKVVLATSPSLECGFAKDIFIRWAPDPRNSIIFTSTTPKTSFASRVQELAKGPSTEKTISCTVREKVFLEGAELALYEVKERKRLRTEAENKAKEIEEAAMEDMMMGIEDFESESEEEETTQQEGALRELCWFTKKMLLTRFCCL